MERTGKGHGRERREMEERVVEDRDGRQRIGTERTEEEAGGERGHLYKPGCN